jgi:hypothetical protein
LKRRIIVLIAVLVAVLVAVVVIAIAIPMLRVHRTPTWAEDSGGFLQDVGRALKEYSLANEGKLPSELGLLYPDYTRDRRVLEQTPSFGMKNTRMALIYWRPRKLGNACAPVAQLVLDPSVKTDYPWRSIVLWGDGRVKLYEL